MILYFFKFLNNVLFYEIFGFPLLVLWLIVTALYLSIKLYFPAERLLRHGIYIAINNEYYYKDPGTITPKQALFSSISGTVGMGTIAGVAIAIKIGGPGAILWMIISVFFTSNISFLEAFLSHEYRKIKGRDKVVGGPYYYLRRGLEDIGYKKFGLILATTYAIMLTFSAFGMSIFQISQAVDIIIDYNIFSFSYFKYIFSFFFSVFSLWILFKDSKKIGSIVEKLVPFMTLLYFISCFIIIIVNYKNFFATISIIFKNAFGIKAEISGISFGIIKAIVNGIKRATFSNEAGLGTSSISHALAKTKESITEGGIASLTPIVNTMCFCFLTGIIIVITGAYLENLEGILMVKKAFLSVSTWFPILLTSSVVLFVISNITTYSFYGKTTFLILTKYKYEFVFNILFALFIFVSAFINIDTVILISDTLILCLCIPNLIGLIMLSKIVRIQLKDYLIGVKAGKYYGI